MLAPRPANGKSLRVGPQAVLHGGKAAAPGLRPGLERQPVGLRRPAGRIARGAQWLLDRWIEMRCLLISNENWTFLDQFKFVRLLGKQPIHAIDDPELNEIFLAWETIEDQWGTRFWLQMQELTPYEDPAFSAWRVWREIVPRPESPEAAVAFLLGIAQREIERLQELLIDLEEIEGDDALELAEQASFCAPRPPSVCDGSRPPGPASCCGRSTCWRNSARPTRRNRRKKRRRNPIRRSPKRRPVAPRPTAPSRSKPLSPKA